MSRFVTRSGAVVECLDPACSCNQPRPKTLPLNKPHTAGAVDAVDEDRWFDAFFDAFQEYEHLYVAHREAPKSERDALALELHEAKLAIVDRFYGRGWKS